jgi:S1-C subfamily serine protease
LAAETPDNTPTAAPQRRRLPVVWVTLAVVAAVVALGAAFLTGRGSAGLFGAETPSPTPKPTRTTPTVPEIYQGVGVSVVVIQTSQGGLGTGTVVAADGSILTANHVVAGSGKITVTFSDGTKSAATVAAADPDNDIATLAPAELPEVLVPATLGGKVEIGSAVAAIGNPLGLTYSITTGVISGLDRTSGTGDNELTGLIQFDAAANPGSSGGPLIDADGGVIGVVVSIADPGGDEAFAGIAFAVPIGAALGGGEGSGPQI